jgi:hypothetical protein
MTGASLEQRFKFVRKHDSQREICQGTADGKSTRFAELPDYEYPAPVLVRNTFIDIPLARPASLDEFLEKREIHSCPPETWGIPDVSDSEKAASSARLLAVAANNAAVVASRAVSSICSWWVPVEPSSVLAGSFLVPAQESIGHNYSVQEMPNDLGAQYALHFMHSASARGEPVLGSRELPTVGSAGHQSGTCKPCAFLHKRGCQNGVQCEFCHLCDEGEKKRRQKEKIARLKSMRGGA